MCVVLFYMSFNLNNNVNSKVGSFKGWLAYGTDDGDVDINN